MRIFHIQGDQFSELKNSERQLTTSEQLSQSLPSAGYLWVGVGRDELEQSLAAIQSALQQWTGGALVDLHVADLLNAQLPSCFDYTSWYDLLVFRRLAASSTTPQSDAVDAHLAQIDTNPVGFAVFDRVLLTVHPPQCQVGEFFAKRLQHQMALSPESKAAETRNGVRMPPSPADLALRMVNHMVDSYLDLRRLLSKQMDELQHELFSATGHPSNWKRLLYSRNGLHLLEDTCEDQRAALTEWIDAQDELPTNLDLAVLRERDLLRVRARDVLEHIERVLGHVRRLEAAAENAVQMHFSAQSNRTNDIMRTLTVLTAIFMPLNLVTGFFGMNFEGLPLIHSARGFWWTLGFMLLIGASLSWFFWRKRYLSSSR
jgi:magnesium transporter